MLAMGTIEPRTITARGIWTDLCENVHLHFRNLRLDFSEKEFAHFRCAINAIGGALEKCAIESDYREGDPNVLIQQTFDVPLASDTDYYPNRFLIELQMDNTVHVHYRDIRLHFTVTEFIKIAGMFTKARFALTAIKDFPYKGITEKVREWVPIQLIQPYDAGHRALDIDKEHREGIEVVKQLMADKKRIRPILVNPEGQRLDGFKRYMAHLELGRQQIECIIDPFGVMGGQHNQSLLDDPETGTG